jgi:predicted Holliday junction resolvase-like endonuclease
LANIIAVSAAINLTILLILYISYTYKLKELKYQKNKIDNDFEIWKKLFISNEVPKIKKEVLKKSRNTIRGIATEHLAPLIQKEYNAKDFRHLGDPVDYIVFDGLSDILDRKANEIVNVILLDVKTGNSKLNKVQRRIRDAIKEGKISFEIYNPDKQSNSE